MRWFLWCATLAAVAAQKEADDGLVTYPDDL